MKPKPITIERVVPEGARVITAYDLDQCHLTPAKATADEAAKSAASESAPRSATSAKRYRATERRLRKHHFVSS